MTTTTGRAPTVNNWTVAAVIGGVALVAMAGWRVSTWESPKEKEARMVAQLDARDQAKAAQLAAQGHPNARVTDVQALDACVTALKRASRDPATANVPDVAWMQGGPDWRFAWTGNHMVRMRNGLGLEVAVPAVCVVDEISGSIKLLSLNGQVLAG